MRVSLSFRCSSKFSSAHTSVPGTCPLSPSLFPQLWCQKGTLRPQSCMFYSPSQRLQCLVSSALGSFISLYLHIPKDFDFFVFCYLRWMMIIPLFHVFQVMSFAKLPMNNLGNSVMTQFLVLCLTKDLAFRHQ